MWPDVADLLAVFLASGTTRSLGMAHPTMSGVLHLWVSLACSTKQSVYLLRKLLHHGCTFPHLSRLTLTLIRQRPDDLELLHNPRFIGCEHEQKELPLAGDVSQVSFLH